MSLVTTSFSQCHKADACRGAYKAMSKALGGIKAHGRHTRTPLADIYEHLGFDDTLWVLGNAAGPEGVKILRLVWADWAEHVLHIFEKEHPNDTRPRDAIQAARDFAEGKISREELAASADRAARAASAASAAWAARADSAAWAAWAARAASADRADSAASAASAARAASADSADRADSAAWAAWAASAARADEHSWQEQRLLTYLRGAP